MTDNELEIARLKAALEYCLRFIENDDGIMIDATIDSFFSLLDYPEPGEWADAWSSSIGIGDGK